MGAKNDQVDFCMYRYLTNGPVDLQYTALFLKDIPYDLPEYGGADPLYVPMNNFKMECHIVESLASLRLKYSFVNTADFDEAVNMKFRWPKNNDIILSDL